jgi:hypothetical protein
LLIAGPLSNLWGTGSLDDKRGMLDADLDPWSMFMLLVKFLKTASRDSCGDPEIETNTLCRCKVDAYHVIRGIGLN